MGHPALTTSLLVFVAVLNSQLTASPIGHPINYGDWQLSDFVMQSPSDANRRVYKEAPQFLSHLNTNDSGAATGSGLTLTQILSDLRAADTPGSDVISPPSKAARLSPSQTTSTHGVVPPPSKVALPPSHVQNAPTHGVVPPPSKASLPSHSGVIPPPPKAALPPSPLQTATTHGVVPPPSKASLPSHSGVIPPPPKAALPPSPLQTATTHGVVPPPSKASSPSHSGVIPPPPRTALPPSPSQTASTHGVVPPPSKAALPPSHVQTARTHGVVPPPLKASSPSHSGVIPPPPKTALPPSPLQTATTHGVVYNPGNGVNSPPSKTAPPTADDVIPPPVQVAWLSPVQTASVSGLVYTSGSYVAPPSRTPADEQRQDNDVGVDDEYLASESIFVTSDVDGYHSPVVDASNTAYTSVRSEDAPGSAQENTHAALADHFPSESMVVTSKVQSLNSAAPKPTGKPGLVQHSIAATPSSASRTNNALYNPHVGTVVDTPYDHVRGAYPGVASSADTAPETVLALEETRMSAISPHTGAGNRVTVTSQLSRRQADASDPIHSSNTVGRVPTFQSKPVAPPVKPVPKISTIKTVNTSPGSSSPVKKLSKADGKTKYPSQTPKMTREVDTMKPSSSMQAPKVVDIPNSDASTLGMRKEVDMATPSNTKQVSNKVDGTKSASNTLDTPKVVAKTKPANTKQVSGTADKPKSAINNQNMPKAVDKYKPSETVQVADTVGKPKTEMPKAVDKTKSSNIMKVPEKVDKTKPTSKVMEIPESRDAIKSDMWPTITPGIPKATISYEKTVEQKKRLLDKMLKWTQLLQSQERERQMEYSELVKELQQLQHLEYQMYNQRGYPYRQF